MPVKMYTRLETMFNDIATYVRKTKNEVFWDDRPCMSTYGLISGENRWAIRSENVLSFTSSDDTELERRFRHFVRTYEGRENLLRMLNAVKNLPEPRPQTAWDRIASDED